MLNRSGLLVRFCSAFSAVAIAVATALSAYAAHGVSGADQVRAYTAAAMLAVHAIGLLSLARTGGGKLLALSRIGILIGLCLFVGSLLAALFLSWRPALAPTGGSLLMLSWLAAAVALWRDSALSHE